MRHFAEEAFWKLTAFEVDLSLSLFCQCNEPLHSPSHLEGECVGNSDSVLVYCALRRPTCLADKWTKLFWGMLKLLFSYSAVTSSPK